MTQKASQRQSPPPQGPPANTRPSPGLSIDSFTDLCKQVAALDQKVESILKILQPQARQNDWHLLRVHEGTLVEELLLYEVKTSCDEKRKTPVEKWLKIPRPPTTPPPFFISGASSSSGSIQMSSKTIWRPPGSVF